MPMPSAAAPTLLQLLQANSLPAVVQVEIEQLILSGELAVGEHVNESDLALRFGTSRGPIREALRALEESRLVRSEKNRGVFVREISVAEADEIYDVREALDQLIGQRVAERATPQQIRGLGAVLAQMDDAAALQDIKSYHALNLKFHDMLVDFAGNSRLTESYRLLTKGLLLFRLRGLQDGGGLAVSNSEHKAVMKAVEARDSARAGNLLRRHAVESRARMHKAAAIAAAK
jgi:phosphonate utilization transcriptional regulator